MEFTAGNLVQMRPGFRAHSGSRFKAHIQGCHYGCDPDFSGKSEELITSIEGILYEDSIDCTIGVEGQGLWVVDDSGSIISSISTIATDVEGSFMFTPSQIQALDTNLIMTFNCSNPDFTIPEVKTLRDWVLDSPIELFLNGCISSGRFANPESGENEDASDVRFNIIPNPNSGIFTITGPNMQRIQILEATGKLVREITPTGNAVQVSGLSAGLYIVWVQWGRADVSGTSAAFSTGTGGLTGGPTF